MSQRRLVILGASGFVGTTLAERMHGRAGWDVVPAIHSAASAWRLARHGRPLLQLDIGDRSALRTALKGATHVVNCTRGGNDVMIDGLKNVLAECRAAGVQRFVHLSSVLVYGDPPPAAAEREDGPVDSGQSVDSYGGAKLMQDRLVEESVKDGLSSVVLCPPNISGPFSLYLCGVVEGIGKSSFALLDDGSTPCNLVDVRTLCAAIEAALSVVDEVADGRRIFVTDGEAYTWREVVEQLLPLAEKEGVRQIDREVLAARIRQLQAKPKVSLSKSLRHLVSSDVRAALRKDPLLAHVDRFARSSITRLGSSVEDALRRSIEGTTPVPRVDPLAGLQIGLCAQQLRTVRHLDERARQRLAAPPISFKESFADFRSWYRSTYGAGHASWDLARRLHAS